MHTRLYEQLRRHEGERLSAYQDSLGYWTIGVGRLIDARKGGGISAEESAFLLQNDVTAKTNDVVLHLPWSKDLDPVRFAALVNIDFQLGAAGLLKFQRTLHAVQIGNYAEAATDMLQSLWARQTPARARELAEQMRTGEWQG